MSLNHAQGLVAVALKARAVAGVAEASPMGRTWELSRVVRDPWALRGQLLMVSGMFPSYSVVETSRTRMVT